MAIAGSSGIEGNEEWNPEMDMGGREAVRAVPC